MLSPITEAQSELDDAISDAICSNRWSTEWGLFAFDHGVFPSFTRSSLSR